MRSQHLLVLFSCLLLVGACGDDDGGGGGADAGDEVDADTSDGGQQVTACGLQLTFPEADRRAGARVVFSLPDGTIFGEAVTDVDGTASRDDCQPGTLITFDLATTAGGGPGGGTFIDAYTIAGVSPGDTVLFPEPQAEPFEANLSVNVPAADGISSNFSFLSNGCSSAFVSFPLTERQLGVSEACLGSDQTVDVVAILQQGNDLVGYSGVTGVAVAEGQTTDVDLPAFTNASADADLVVTTSNPPAGTTVDAQASQGRDLVSLFGSSSEVIAGTANLDLLPSTLADFMDLR
ncbi:MAG: hypothetical protein KJO07_00065, partial [Deltaproteobacteria bacterium]|nr:hypothetical protein [Deltaproteobacteria bacterium]